MNKSLLLLTNLAELDLSVLAIFCKLAMLFSSIFIHRLLFYPFRDSRQYFIPFFYQLEEVLGSEIAECLHWRRGALLYMYCSTVQEDKERLKRNSETFRQVHLKLLLAPIKKL